MGNNEAFRFDRFLVNVDTRAIIMDVQMVRGETIPPPAPANLYGSLPFALSRVIASTFDASSYSVAGNLERNIEFRPTLNGGNSIASTTNLTG